MQSLTRVLIVLSLGVAAVPAELLQCQQASDYDSVYVVAVYDPERDPAADLTLAVERAERQRKRVLMVVGGDWCIDCVRLDLFIRQTPAVAAALAAHFVVLKVNVSRDNENESFLAGYPGIEWYPHVFVLHSDGSLRHSQDTRALHERGRSYGVKRFLDFLDKWSNRD